jgi:hypothetical protein
MLLGVTLLGETSLGETSLGEQTYVVPMKYASGRRNRSDDFKALWSVFAANAKSVFFPGVVQIFIARNNEISCRVVLRCHQGAGLPDFSLYMIPKPEKMHQINTKCTKWS